MGTNLAKPDTLQEWFQPNLGAPRRKRKERRFGIDGEKVFSPDGWLQRLVLLRGPLKLYLLSDARNCVWCHRDIDVHFLLSFVVKQNSIEPNNCSARTRPQFSALPISAIEARRQK